MRVTIPAAAVIARCEESRTQGIVRGSFFRFMSQPALLAYVGYRWKTGQHMLTASFSHFDPIRTSPLIIQTNVKIALIRYGIFSDFCVVPTGGRTT